MGSTSLASGEASAVAAAEFPSSTPRIALFLSSCVVVGCSVFGCAWVSSFLLSLFSLLLSLLLLLEGFSCDGDFGELLKKEVSEDCSVRARLGAGGEEEDDGLMGAMVIQKKRSLCFMLTLVLRAAVAFCVSAQAVMLVTDRTMIHGCQSHDSISIISNHFSFW
jgi:hypothetical protein